MVRSAVFNSSPWIFLTKPDESVKFEKLFYGGAFYYRCSPKDGDVRLKIT